MSFYRIAFLPQSNARAARAIVKFNGAPNSDAEMAKFMAELDALFKHKQPFGVLFDLMSVGSSLPPKYGTAMGKWMLKNEANIRAYFIRSVVLTDSIAVRGFLNIIYAVKKPIKPQQVCNTHAAAQKFLGW